MDRFVICIDNRPNRASLIVGKVYRIVADEDAESHGMVRVADEDTSEPDGYLYPSAMFVPIDLPAAARHAIA
jgi:hypothetical protein